ncbi:YbjN domain-containing protein [Saccharopolyspora sp. NPDC000359]|uniref:YbjN domain-containing protein n=1 Tax=Saccharopolyspora sp. NPDC000359 TaxID=3154251 RepID=UPI0033218FFF
MSLDEVIKSTLDDNGLEHQQKGSGRFFVTLPGTKKLQTNCWLVVAEHALVVEAFVCRQPDEAHEEVYRFLLRRNAKLYGVHYTLDANGDIYLVGRIGRHAVTAEELDRVLGQVLEAADGDFNTLLELGFATAIRREWGWRESRGESLANLQPFRQLVERDGPLEPLHDQQ